MSARVTTVFLIALLTALVAVACSSAATPTPSPTATPRLTGAPRVTPVPTPTPEGPDLQAQNREVVRRFGQDFSEAQSGWDTFRQEFADWRRSITSCSRSDRQRDLNQSVVDFQPVARAVTALRFPLGTDEARSSLAAALSTEESGLRELRDTWVTAGTGAFAAYEDARTEASIGRLEARAKLARAEAIPGISALNTALQAAEDEWNAFHERYDQWRAQDGDCSQATVRSRLNDFAAQFDDVLGSVTAISRPSVVRPLAERLIDAVTTESQALWELRDGWVPYETGPWDRFDDRIAGAAQQRRQVQSSLDELTFQYGL